MTVFRLTALVKLKKITKSEKNSEVGVSSPSFVCVCVLYTCYQKKKKRKWIGGLVGGVWLIWLFSDFWIFFNSTKQTPLTPGPIIGQGSAYIHVTPERVVIHSQPLLSGFQIFVRRPRILNVVACSASDLRGWELESCVCS